MNLNELIREVLVLSQVQLRNALIEVRTELDDNLPTLSADRVQLQQVLFNLITNAIDAINSVVGRNRILRIGSDIAGNRWLLVR